MTRNVKDHGGGLDAAIAKYGGTRAEWIDLSTGINPNSYPIPNVPAHFWQDLPDETAQQTLLSAARVFWNVPDDADIVACAGLSQMIAALPLLHPTAAVQINKPTYNEHEAAFRANGWDIDEASNIRVVVHPNNPDGRQASLSSTDLAQSPLTIIDESFCDTQPDMTYIGKATTPNVVVLKGLGKFWGLAGLRLGFAISHKDTTDRLRDFIGPWAVSGPAQFIGAQSLSDTNWSDATRARLQSDSKRLDDIAHRAGFELVGGTDLFRLYETPSASHVQDQLAQNFIWSRRFPYSKTWLRLGLAGPESHWQRLAAALDI